MRFASAAAVFCACVATSLSAAAQAPITFAGQGGAREVQTASVDARLAGGSETSYGYGSGSQSRGGAVIDLRRSASRAEPQRDEPAPVQAQPVAAEQRGAEEGAQAWLERERVGPPYEVNGRWYVPTPEPGYEQTGTASWYGPQFHGQRTASGEVFDQTAMTAAHPTLPIPSLVQVTNLENGREVIVRVNDRGPFVGDRLIDLSRGSAQVLGFEGQGQTRVHVRYLGPAPRLVNAGGASAPAAAQPSAAPAEGPMQLTVEPAPSQFAEAPSPQPEPEYREQAPSYAAPAPSFGDAYFVQVGAFSDLTNAHRVRSAVQSAGPVAVDTRQTASGELFRVRLGPFADRGEAESARRELASLGFGDAILAAR